MNEDKKKPDHKVSIHSEQPVRSPYFSERPPGPPKEVLRAAPKPPKGD